MDNEGKPTRVGFQIDGENKTRVARSNGGNIPEKVGK
jgi:hypothetical protein